MLFRNGRRRNVGAIHGRSWFPKYSTRQSGNRTDKRERASDNLSNAFGSGAHLYAEGVSILDKPNAANPNTTPNTVCAAMVTTTNLGVRAMPKKTG